MALPFVPTHSVLDTLSTCPRKYQAQYVTKELQFVDNPATLFGKWLHSAVEVYIKSGVLPAYPPAGHFGDYDPALHFSHAKNVIDNVRATQPTRLLTEAKIAVDAQLRGCSYYEKTGYFRAIADVLAIYGDCAVLIDWKTGKQRDSVQQERSAVCVFGNYENVTAVKTLYVYTATGIVVGEVYKREDLNDIKRRVLEGPIENLEAAYESDTWLPSPSGLCKAWCDVKCQHNQKM